MSDSSEFNTDPPPDKGEITYTHTTTAPPGQQAHDMTVLYWFEEGIVKACHGGRKFL